MTTTLSEVPENALASEIVKAHAVAHVSVNDAKDGIGRAIDFTVAFLCRRFIMDQNFIEEFRRRSPRTRFLYWVWRLTSDCGRSVTRWAMCTAGMVMLFAWLFTIVGVDFGTYQTWLSPLYFSVVTITTLGYGDVLPSTATGQFLVMCEVVTGYVMLGGLLSLFSNNMASRAE